MIYREKLGIEWSPPFDLKELEKLEEAFSRDSLTSGLNPTRNGSK